MTGKPGPSTQRLLHGRGLVGILGPGDAMDKEKTGALIGAVRKEKNMTQKELAALLHVSDRAVSKWERGAGFPDVSLLEPLAEALDLTVLDLLRGERTEETDVHKAVAEALDAFQEKQRQTRKYVLREILRVLVFLLVFGGIVLTISPIHRKVDQTITAGVYVDGVLAAYTDVEMQGEVSYLLSGRRKYWGRFAIGCVEWTCREGASVSIAIDKKEGERGVGAYCWNGTLAGDLVDFDSIFSPDMTQFAMALQSPNHLISGQPRAESWCVLATSPELYGAYCAGLGNPPPQLTVPHPGQLPEFSSPWKQW